MPSHKDLLDAQPQRFIKSLSPSRIFFSWLLIECFDCCCILIWQAVHSCIIINVTQTNIQTYSSKCFPLVCSFDMIISILMGQTALLLQCSVRQRLSTILCSFSQCFPNPFLLDFKLLKFLNFTSQVLPDATEVIWKGNCSAVACQCATKLWQCNHLPVSS